ncbi:hypothetical protein GCM10010417_35270 [Streptomyces carpaticus]
MAYRVLMHAELERYFEDSILCSAQSSLHIFHNCGGRIVVPAAAAVVHHQSKLFFEGKNGSTSYYLSKTRIVQAMPNRLELAIETIENGVVGANNGIKKKDIRKLVGWIGIDISEIDANLLAALETFGAERGDAAHLSRREIRRRYHRGTSGANQPKVRRLPSPSDEVSAVNAVISLLPEFDRIIQKRMREVL